MDVIPRSLTGDSFSPEYYIRKAGGGPAKVYISEEYPSMTSGSLQAIVFPSDSSSVTLHNRAAFGGPNLYFYLGELTENPVELVAGYSVSLPKCIANGCTIKSAGTNAKWQIIITL